MRRLSQKLKNFFNKRKQKQAKKSFGRKRQILASVAFVGSLVFGRVSSAKTQNYQTTTTLAHKRVIQNNELTIYDSEKSILHHQNVVN